MTAHSMTEFEQAEEQRKGSIFIYFLGTVFLVASIDLLYNFYFSLGPQGPIATTFTRYFSISIGTVTFLGLLWVLNRWFPKTARHIFILFMGLLLIFVFEVEGLSDIFVGFAVPIIMAAFLIKPMYSFVHWAVIISAYAFRLHIENSFNIESFFWVGTLILLVIAVVSWVIARSLDKALADSWFLNRELDQRVQDRTQQLQAKTLELADSLKREHETAVRSTTILESIADGIVVFDANQQVVMANPAANAFAKQDLKLLTLDGMLDTIEADSKAALHESITRELHEEHTKLNFEWHNKTISATIASVILNPEESKQIAAGNVIVLRDFTREARLQKAKDVFLGTVSHELRTPISAITGYLELLLDAERGMMSENGYKQLQTVRASARQLLLIANDLIELSRIETGEIELIRDWMDIETVVKQSVKIVEQEFVSRNLSLTLDVENNLPKLYVDQARISQILLNLLCNAYKYTRQGGATVRVSQSEGWINVSVTDTGVGISEADKKNMFQRFFRSADTAVQQAGGTGLGLSVSKGFSELHGGTLTFESQYGEGTTFTLSLPVGGNTDTGSSGNSHRTEKASTLGIISN